MLNLLTFSVFLLSFISSIHQTNAVTYYVSVSQGNDRNLGTSPSRAWRSFQPIYSRVLKFQAGDKILFCRGETWMFSNIFAYAIGAVENPITWGAYQCSTKTENPVISTAVNIPFSAWMDNGSTITTSLDMDDTAKQANIRAVWAGETRQLPARFPNLRNFPDATLKNEAEFLWHTPSVANDNRLNNPALNQAPGYWVGATVYVRSSNWAYQQTKVVASGLGWIQVEGVATNARYGFYIEQSRATFSRGALLQADSPGEYTFDATSAILTIYPENAATKAKILNGQLEVNFLYNTVSAAAMITGQFHVIEDITFKWVLHGITNTNRAKFIAQRNNIINVAGWGVTSKYSPYSVVRDNYIKDAEADCIVLDASGGVVQGNTVENCGMYAGYGVAAGGTGTGIATISADVIENTIKNCGYSGIVPHYSLRIAYNKISGVMNTLNDGGGIYLYGAGGRGLTLEGNQIENVVGNYLSWMPWPIASCVFSDQGTSNVVIFNNTCTNAPQCMQLNSAHSNSILSNQCNSPGIYLNDYSTGNPIGEHVIIGNQVVTSGTNGYLQNPVARVYAPGRQSLEPVSQYSDNVYCQTVDSNTYMFQKDFGIYGTTRFPDFPSWRQSECVNKTNCKFEARSAWYFYNCDRYRPAFVANTVDEIVAYGRQLLEAERQSSQAAAVNNVIVISVSAVAAFLLVGAVVSAYFYYRQQAKTSVEDINPSSADSPSNHGEFELVVTPEIERSFSWSQATITQSTPIQ